MVVFHLCLERMIICRGKKELTFEVMVIKEEIGMVQKPSGLQEDTLVCRSYTIGREVSTLFPHLLCSSICTLL